MKYSIDFPTLFMISFYVMKKMIWSQDFLVL